ncbi:hypothetical protein [Enhygromyxa salina]|uniref:DUF2185 domain-containing protein n=1 Tax=Enhygromyxa salina TaxID=215803 RepID=A0A2S9XGC3_9BACT|nr:hypothetical protein [Enhygromyxa salina]PRP91800.1 hypothetical protein ENSA7_81880 [Enhygromyxa salina]
MNQEFDYHLKSYICVHVFKHERPVLLVCRGADGDWGLYCGSPHKDSGDDYRVVGIGHVIDDDPALREVLDLEPGWEAERSGLGEPWRRSLSPDEDDAAY